jgi:hypothetical protein
VNLDDVVAQLACELYVKSGRIEGLDFDNWIRAEGILRSRCNSVEDIDDLLHQNLTWKELPQAALERLRYRRPCCMAASAVDRALTDTTDAEP